MTKTEMLFVRACKNFDAVKRIKSIYKRFYAISKESLDEMFEQNIVHILASIVDDYYPMKFAYYLSSRGEYRNQCIVCKSLDHKDCIYTEFDADLRAIVNHFRFMNADKYKELGVIVPIQFRR